MRLRTFTGKSMKEVMARVRSELGPDAIIVNVDQGKRVGGARVTAAFEGKPAPERQSATPRPSPSPGAAGSGAASGRSRPYDVAELTAVLSHQSIPYDLATRLQTAVSGIEAETLQDALAAALETCFLFRPIADEAQRPLMLVGPPGAGKTVSTAKIAAEATLNGMRVRLISTDTVKSTGIDQLEGFAHLVELGVETAEAPDQLAGLLSHERCGTEAYDLTLIDTQGISPFRVEELEDIAHLIRAAGAEPVLVLPAGIDPAESADIAEIFSQMGARRMIATRLDTARRYASILTAAQAGRLAIAAFSRSPYVAQNLEAATPYLLARIIAALPKSRFIDPKNEQAAQ